MRTLIAIEEYSHSYLEDINYLLLKDTNYIPKICNTKHTLLLFENNNIIGIGAIWDNPIHPYRDYISIYIEPSRRNRGFGKLLFQELVSRYKLKKLQTAFDSDNIEAVSFVEKCGFSKTRKSYCYDVDERLLKAYIFNVSGRIVRLSNLALDILHKAIVLQYEDYKINHQHINPLSKDIELDTWKEIILDELVKEDSYVLMNNDIIEAYLFSYEIDEESICIGYTGSRCRNFEDYKAFLYTIVKHLFKSYKKIELEIDDCDNSANILADLFNYKSDSTWDTYIMDI